MSCVRGGCSMDSHIFFVELIEELNDRSVFAPGTTPTSIDTLAVPPSSLSLSLSPSRRAACVVYYRCLLKSIESHFALIDHFERRSVESRLFGNV